MNAIQFIQQNGVEKARKVVEGAPEKATIVSAETYAYFYKYQDSPVWDRVYRRKDGSEWSCTRFSPIINPIELSDLKRLVESVDLIKFYNGIEKANFLLEMSNRPSLRPPHPSEVKLKQAIANYEAIYGDSK